MPKKLKFDISAIGITVETVVIGHTNINELIIFQMKPLFRSSLGFTTIEGTEASTSNEKPNYLVGIDEIHLKCEFLLMEVL